MTESQDPEWLGGAASTIHPHVRVRLSDGSEAELQHGDLIGRLWSAALPIDDPRISEAHAFVSLRTNGFWLLSLRRMVAVAGKAVSEVALRPGLLVELADQLTLEVTEVVLPREVLVLEGEGLPSAVLPSVCSITTSPRPALSSRHDPSAPCQIWTTGAGWRLRIHDVQRLLPIGVPFEVDGLRLMVSARPVPESVRTQGQGGVHAPLRLEVSFDTVHLHRRGEPALVIGGVSGRVLAELAAIRGPVHWETVAREIWLDEPDPLALRKRWDVSLARLRVRLREARVRHDLVTTDKNGIYALLLREGDEVDDKG
jgi:hypothetical protein